MSMLARQRVSAAMFVVASACLLLSPALSFKAGCAGDAKTAALGNIEVALQYGRMAMLALLAGASLGAAGFLIRAAPEANLRAGYATAWFFIGGTLSWLASFQAEGWGVQSCF